MRGKPAEDRFARLPNAWIYDDGLRRFRTRSRDRGASGGALMVLVAILVKARNDSDDRAGPLQGSASLTYEELEHLTDLSRASISKGLRLLEQEGVIRTVHEGQGRKNRYFVRDYGADDKYGRLSATRMYGGSAGERLRTLHDLSIRNETDVNALKIYLFLCAAYDRGRYGALVNYKTIAEKTGVAENKIRRALSVLYEHNLARVSEYEVKDGDPTLAHPDNPPNFYRVLGI